MRDRREAILQAKLVTVQVGRYGVSPHAQRLLLLALAAHDGSPVTTWRLKADSDLGERRIRLAIQALESAGLVVVTPGKPNTYHVQWARLAPKVVPA